ncbi:3-oxoacyl-[acyl-carrier protein] reductase [Flavobacterium sp. HSC-32F16]|uniref:SDR family NAD(P)-dependent oxidoreductase n=1 Tax=Flavobacterium sp. HSC-32F16 TaxID=2910964 RepID=UPI0020A51C3E|nr:SDR family oxidoreductase [Flavobacterium sp. HSC-32F16]MCP2025179.1 3-oxoacyl-[acyl-carrier protein] reductase [Flavobacterium sp. HSC-32F16]
MKTILEHKVVVVTGASKGIGAGIAKKMAESGAKVIVNYASSKQDAEEVVAEITKSGGIAAAVKADISILTDVKQLFQETIKIYGRLDALVNNAGIYEFELLESFTEESYRKTFDINVLGVLLASKEAAALFDKNGGSIINISSFAGTRPEPYSVVYAASKGAVDSITYALSQELGPKNIRVNSIRPGGVFTEGVAKLGASLESDVILGTVKRSALGRMAMPDDIGNMAVFFASDESKIITGQTVEVSGGFK